MTEKDIIKFIQNQGYHGAEKLDVNYHDFAVYSATFEMKDGLPPVIGYPVFFLVKGYDIREADMKETIEIMKL